MAICPFLTARLKILANFLACSFKIVNPMKHAPGQHKLSRSHPISSAESGRPYTLALIERALRDVHFNVDPKHSAKQQALEVLV